MEPHPSEASRVPETASLIDNQRHGATAPPGLAVGPSCVHLDVLSNCSDYREL